MMVQESKLHDKLMVYSISLLLLSSIVSTQQQHQSQNHQSNQSSRRQTNINIEGGVSNDINDDVDRDFVERGSTIFNCQDSLNITFASEEDRKKEEMRVKVCRQSEFMRSLQMESIKASILKRLNISNPLRQLPAYREPDSDRFINLKRVVENEYRFMTETKNKEIYVKPVKLEANGGDGKLLFHLRRDITEIGLEKATLNLFVRNPLIYNYLHPPWLLIYYNDFLILRKTLNLEDSKLNKNWQGVDMTQNLQDFLRGREEVLRNFSSISNPPPLDSRLDQYKLEVLCYDSEGDACVILTAADQEEQYNLPMLKIQMRDIKISRSKRDMRATCNKGSSSFDCCRYNFYIDFEKLGWHFVEYPKILNVYYCSGECQHSNNPYYAATDPYVKSGETRGRVKCCSAKSYSTVSILYRTLDNIMDVGTLDAAVVDKCGCA